MPASQDLRGKSRPERLEGFRVDLPNNTLAPSIGRRWVKGLQGRIPQEVIDRLELLVSELITNSVLHAELSPEARIELRLEMRPGLLHVEVLDRGRGFRPTRHPRPGHLAGWGLYLVDEIADRWGSGTNGETTVWFELRLPG